MQCSVCWEDFKLAEPVRKLVCEHLYHTQCIVPWLQLHGTCPNCRKALADDSVTLAFNYYDYYISESLPLKLDSVYSKLSEVEDKSFLNFSRAPKAVQQVQGRAHRLVCLIQRALAVPILHGCWIQLVSRDLELFHPYLGNCLISSVTTRRYPWQLDSWLLSHGMKQLYFIYQFDIECAERRSRRSFIG